MSMLSAEVTEWGQPPKSIKVPPPAAPVHDNETEIKVLAAGLHQLVRTRAAGKHYTATELPHVPGVDGVGINLSTGKKVYFSLLGTKQGSYAEIVNAPTHNIVELPEGVDPVVAAAMVNPVMASWMALRKRVDWPGKEGKPYKVFINGVTSASGKIAIKVARHLGATTVVGAARNKDALSKLDLDASVVLQEPNATDFSAAADADIVLDFLYGPWPNAFLLSPSTASAKNPITWINIGSMAGDIGDISAQPPNMSQPSKEARVILALQALQNDPKLSFRRAAQIYEVDRNTLRNRKNGRQSRRDTMANSRKLSKLEEETILQYALDLDSRGLPCRISVVEDMANRLLAARDAPPVGKRWAINFIQRQPELKSRYQRRYDYQRALCEDPTIIRNWFRLVENTIAKYGIRSDDIWNFDETGFMMGMISAGKVVTSAERRGRPKSVQPGSREWVTVIEAANAEGQSIPPFIIVTGKHHLRNWYEGSSLPADWAIATTPNGWTNNDTGLDWLKHFDKHTINRSVGSYRLLILDGHESHHSTDFEAYCKEKNIIPLYMPPHSSHLLQPLDIGCFGPLKRAYGREIEHLIRRSITHITKTQFFPAFYAAHQAAITESNIRGGFRGAGLAPFDPENVISKLNIRLQTPTPPKENTSQAQPWTPKTPRTVTEADSHSEYLQRRIRRHHSSSPESILEALRSLTKSVMRNMHKTALLEAEVEDLREANATQSRKKRAKRTRLQDSGRMTIGTGQSQIDQIDVDTQIVAESSRSGGRGRSEGPKVRHCRTCGKAGHNARTCQEAIEVTKDKDSN